MGHCGQSLAAGPWGRASRNKVLTFLEKIRAGQCLHLKIVAGGSPRVDGDCCTDNASVAYVIWMTAQRRWGGGAWSEIPQREARAHGTKAPLLDAKK